MTGAEPVEADAVLRRGKLISLSHKGRGKRACGFI
jgi:hypothetical protein